MTTESADQPRCLVFRRQRGALSFGPDALATLERFRQYRSSDAEAGGVLLGRRILDSDDVVIDIATAPNELDRRSRYSFNRVAEPAQVAVNRAWAESRGTCVYLGDWHSHPEPAPHPSYVDEDDWRKIMRSAKYGQPFLFFVIVGTEEIAVWEYPLGARSPKRLAAYDDERRPAPGAPRNLRMLSRKK